MQKMKIKYEIFEPSLNFCMRLDSERIPATTAGLGGLALRGDLPATPIRDQRTQPTL